MPGWLFRWIADARDCPCGWEIVGYHGRPPIWESWLIRKPVEGE